MHDPAFKTVFCHPTAIERLVRRYAGEHADRIDFSTLTKLDAELVGNALVRRYPDMLWMARVRDGEGRMVIQLEFQGDWDWLMRLRMAIYQLMTVQQIFQRKPCLRREGSLEVLSFVIYHGRGTGKGAVGLRRLFPRWAAGEYRLIARQGSGFEGDLAQTVLALELDRSVEGTQAVLAELTRIAERTGSDYAGLMAEGVAEMLVSTGRITREQVREAKTMAQVATTYQQSLEEYGRRHREEAMARRQRPTSRRDEGRAEAAATTSGAWRSTGEGTSARGATRGKSPCCVSWCWRSSDPKRHGRCHQSSARLRTQSVRVRLPAQCWNRSLPTSSSRSYAASEPLLTSLCASLSAILSVSWRTNWDAKTSF